MLVVVEDFKAQGTRTKHAKWKPHCQLSAVCSFLLHNYIHEKINQF